MLIYALLSLFGSLILTIIIELVFLLLMKVHGKDLLLVVLANVLTNPIVVSFSVFITSKLTAPLEIAAILTEAYIYRKYSENIRHPMIFSFLANAVSYTAGLIISLL